MIKILFNMVILTVSLVVTHDSLAESFNGKSQWVSYYEISSRISSRIASIDVTVGQKVKKGQILLLMDEAVLSHDVNIAKAEAIALSPEKDQSKMDFNRALELYDRTLISDVTLKQAEFKFVEAKARYEAALSKQQKAEFLFNSASIKSPINGRVLRINSNQGMYVDKEGSQSLLTLIDDQKMKAVTYLKVSQWDVNLLGQKGSVLINGHRYKGIVNGLNFVPVENAKGLSVYEMSMSFNPKKRLPSGVPLTMEIP